MLSPKRVKYRKVQKGRMKGNAHRGADIAFGSFALKSLETAWLNSRQIEAAREALSRNMKKEGQVCIRTLPDNAITTKPEEVRMGKGKGAPEDWEAVVKPGRIMFEVKRVDIEAAKEALRLAAQNLPVKTK